MNRKTILRLAFGLAACALIGAYRVSTSDMFSSGPEIRLRESILKRIGPQPKATELKRFFLGRFESPYETKERPFAIDRFPCAGAARRRVSYVGKRRPSFMGYSEAVVTIEVDEGGSVCQIDWYHDAVQF